MARSAKQKANDKRLGRMAKARAKANKPKRKALPKKQARRKATKVNKPKSPKKTMTNKGSSFASKIPVINNPTFKKAALGVGTAALGVAVISIVAPQIASNPVVKPVLAFVGGGIPGVVAQVITQGGISGLTNILGGGNGNGGGSNAGFA